MAVLKDDQEPESPLVGPFKPAYLGWHMAVYAVVNSLLFLVDYLQAGGWWFFYPLIGWGAFVLFHLLTLRSLVLDDGWADEKAHDMRMKAYDASHIRNIASRYSKTPTSGEPRKPGDVVAISPGLLAAA